MSSIDQQFVEFVVKSLVGNPEAVKIERRIDEKGVLLELTVAPEDLGRVIGKHGATAQSLRTLLRALGTKNDARYNLKIIDNGVKNDDDSVEQPNKSFNSTTEVEAKSDEFESSIVEDEEVEDKYSKTRQELEDLDDLDL